MADVFISYARADKDFVRRLHQGLEEINREIWVDWEDIPPTAEWRKEIFASIAAADNFLFVISPSSCASEMCREELAYAEANHKRLVPVVQRPVPHQDLPPALARIQWISFCDADFDNAFRGLIEAIDTDLEWVHEHTRLLVRAREWEARNHDASLLLRGKDLLDAERWQSQASSREPKPNALQSKFLFASRQGQTRRQRFVLGGVTAALVLSGALTVFALLEWRQAIIQKNQAVSRQFAAQSIQESANDLGAALGEAVAAGERAHTDEAQIALGEAVGNPQERYIFHHTGPVESAVFSPDGRRIVTASVDNTARVWDAGDGHPIVSLVGHTSVVNSAVFSPDGGRIVTASDDHTARVWDAADGHLLTTLAGHTDPVTSAVFSPDGRRIVTASFDHTAKVWDAGDGHLLAKFTGHTDRVSSVAFSPDGNRIITASYDETAKVYKLMDFDQLLARAVQLLPVNAGN